MRKSLFITAILLLLLALAIGLGGCERAKPAPTPTSEPEPTIVETPIAVTPAMASPIAPEGSATPALPPPPSAETPTPPPAQPPEQVPTQAPAPVPGEGVEHVVRWGETVYLIASRYGVSVQDIVAANNLTNPDLIRAGDVLIIPGGAAPSPEQPGVHIVRRGETLNTIARMYGTTVNAIARANGIVNPNYIYVGQRLTIPGGTTGESTGGQTYVVQRGDTLSSIAVRFGTTAWAIAYANNLPNVNIIYVGQTLYIP
jgi:LysM repeat protein